MTTPCGVLHSTAVLEHDLFGEVVSPSVLAHVEQCPSWSWGRLPRPASSTGFMRGFMTLEDIDRFLEEQGHDASA